LQCFNIWDEFVECADQTGCGTGPSGLSWDYQVIPFSACVDRPSSNDDSGAGMWGDSLFP